MTKRDESHIYVNLNQYNTGLFDEPINIQKIYSEVILPNSSDYEMSVIRFDLYGINIPIINLQNYFIGGVAPNTILDIKFVYNATEFIRPLIWQSFSTVPNDYLYYDYNHIATIFNNTLNLLTSDVNTAFPGTINIAPRLEYDPLTTRYALYAEKAVFTDNLVNPVEIWLNGTLYDLFQNLPSIFFQDSTGVSQSYSRLKINQILNPYSNIDNSKIINLIDHWVMIQNTQSLNALNSANSIVLTSDLPIVEEYISSIGGISVDNTATIQYPIVSDFILDSENGYEIFNHITYIPSAQYRMLSLTGARPIQSIKLKMFWSDANGKLNPLLLAPKRRVNIKILFRRKDWQSYK
jgi:hypothetical protein